MLKPRRLVPMAILIVCAVVWVVLRHGEVELLLFALFIVGIIPATGYFSLARAVDANKQFTDPKTLEFGPSRLVVIGPDWKSEMGWSRFHGFSEDETYFYLHLSPSGVASILPKSAFSSEQQRLFREYASTRNA
jgi:hypothetical protein